MVLRVVAFISVLVVLAVAGCGSSSSSPTGVSAASYVKAVCTAVRGWTLNVEARSGALNLATVTDLTRRKAVIEEFFDSAVADTGAVVSKLKAAGTPRVTNGEQISSAFVSTFGQLQAAFVKGQRQARALPTGDPTAFRNADRALANSVGSAVNNIGTGLSRLKSAELDKAIQKQPACAPFTS